MVPMEASAGVSVAQQQLPEDLLSQKSPKFEGVQRDFTWEEVKLLVAAGRLDLLGRKTPEELAYRDDMAQIRKQYGTIVAFMQTVKLAAFLADADAQYLMIPNDYPYALPENTLHYILWSKPALASGTVPDAEVKALFESNLDSSVGAGKYEWVWFVNPPHLQSIPEVVHGHLIVKRHGSNNLEA
ncbi:hypothetical protein LPJ59_003250 [Coemansia sp. RSA 2399]|nr:hypothetical protein LPJ59_003250 [Coemansia sp. RSA 2399]KAJ1903721.1 hypothetical protein LPJ81_002908 [Coemansia sp. IMI 209127]